jgi:hypothetical protein
MNRQRMFNSDPAKSFESLDRPFRQNADGSVSQMTGAGWQKIELSGVPDMDSKCDKPDCLLCSWFTRDSKSSLAWHCDRCAKTIYGLENNVRLTFRAIKHVLITGHKHVGLAF